MLPLILVVLSQAPAHTPVGVVVSSKRPGSDAAAQKVATRMVEALGGAKFTGVLDDAATGKLLKRAKLNARDCQGAGPCLIKLAKALGPTAIVIGVDVGKIGDSLAIHVEAVGVEASVLAVDVPADADLKPGQLDALDGFAKSVAEKLTPTPAADQAPPPSDAPKAAVLEPTPPPTPPPAVTAARAGPSTMRKVVPWIVGGGAVASLAVSGAFFGLGAQDKSKFDASVSGGVSRLPGSELQRISSSGNMNFTIGLSTAVVGVALAACSAVLFATE